MIDPDDDEIHPVGDDVHWQESWYFNWADPRERVFGLSRIGFRFHEHRVDALVLSIRDGRPEHLHAGVHRRRRGPWSWQSASDGLCAGELRYVMEAPLRRWRLILEGRHRMDLAFETFTAPFDYRDSAGIPEGLATGHLEQSGRVRGWTEFRGRRRSIDGLGQRDRSWGPRDWAHLAGWEWISAQFGETLAFGAWQGGGHGDRSVGGYVFRDGANHAIEVLDIRYEWAGPHRPRSAVIDVVDATGLRHRLVAAAAARFTLWKRGLWVEEVPASFVCERPGHDALHGAGVIEHAWRAGVRGTLAGAPALLRTAAVALRR